MNDRPINLNQFRKAKARIKKRAQDNENSVKFGRSKQEKLMDRAEVTSLREKLDGHKRET
jgi:hypothetical protein